MLKSIKGIYLIERIGGDFAADPRRYYVGLAEDIFLRLNQHCCGIEQFIDKAIGRYGMDAFRFQILENVSNKRSLKARESVHIAAYRAKYGDRALYNIAETANQNPTKADRATRAAIRARLNQDIGQSIYVLAEEFNTDWHEVKDIRKPLLKANGLKYDRRMNQVVEIATGQVPANWRGGQLTPTLLAELKETGTIDPRHASRADVALVMSEE